MEKKQVSPFQKNRNEILYNFINAGIAGALVFVGAFADGEITSTGVCAALVAAVVVGLTKFRDYWTGQAEEYKCSILSFY